jgi:thiamine-monophosphate kinase
MASWPVAVVASFCFGPTWRTASRRALYRSVLRAVRARGAQWIGGDLAAVDGPSVLTLCAIGRLAGRRAVPRGGLRPGHLLLVSGPLGNSLGSGWHLDFDPRLEWGCRLGRLHRVPAMMDVSDGLLLDLSRMLRASGGLGATLWVDQVPRRGGCPLPAALGDGEDHELLVGVSARTLAGIQRDRRLPADLRRPIGVVEARPGLRLLGSDGRRISTRHLGYQHELG